MFVMMLEQCTHRDSCIVYDRKQWQDYGMTISKTSSREVGISTFAWYLSVARGDLYGAGRSRASRPAVYHGSRSCAILCQAGVCRGPDMFRQPRSLRRRGHGGWSPRQRCGCPLRTLAPTLA